jgi:hypothetical protein
MVGSTVPINDGLREGLWSRSHSSLIECPPCLLRSPPKGPTVWRLNGGTLTPGWAHALARGLTSDATDARRLCSIRPLVLSLSRLHSHCGRVRKSVKCGTGLGFAVRAARHQFWSTDLRGWPFDRDQWCTRDLDQFQPMWVRPILAQTIAEARHPLRIFGPSRIQVLGRICFSVGPNPIKKFLIKICFFVFLFWKIRKLANGPINKLKIFCCGVIWMIMFNI